MIVTPQKSSKRNKYGNKKVEADGYKFDSKLEERYYQKLKLDKRLGHIKDFELQPVFELQPKFKKYNKTIRKIEYKADFKIEHLDGSIEVVDIKGHKTKDFMLKRKLFDYQNDLPLRVLKYSKAKGWYEV